MLFLAQVMWRDGLRQWGQFCHAFASTTLITLMFDKRCKKVVEAVAKLHITTV